MMTATTNKVAARLRLAFIAEISGGGTEMKAIAPAGKYAAHHQKRSDQHSVEYDVLGFRRAESGQEGLQHADSKAGAHGERRRAKAAKNRRDQPFQSDRQSGIP